MAVAADDGFAGLGRAELGPDDVHDATVIAVDTVQLQAEVVAVLLQCTYLLGRSLADDREVLETREGDGRC